MKNTETIKKIKKNLKRGDFAILIDRIKSKHNLTISRSAVAATLSPANPYFNDLIYAEALQLSIERKEAVSQTATLEKLL